MLTMILGPFGGQGTFVRLWRTATCLTAMSAGFLSAISNTATCQTNSDQSKDTQAASTNTDSGEQKVFKAVSMGDGQLEDGTWFHNLVYAAPDGETVTLMRAKFASVNSATQWVNNMIKGALKVAERGPVIDEHGVTLGERIMAVFPAKSSERPWAMLIWTDGPLVREIYSPSSEDVSLAERTFSPRYYALSHAEKRK